MSLMYTLLFITDFDVLLMFITDFDVFFMCGMENKDRYLILIEILRISVKNKHICQWLTRAKIVTCQ